MALCLAPIRCPNQPQNTPHRMRAHARGQGTSPSSVCLTPSASGGACPCVSGRGGVCMGGGGSNGQDTAMMASLAESSIQTRTPIPWKPLGLYFFHTNHFLPPVSWSSGIPWPCVTFPTQGGQHPSNFAVIGMTECEACRRCHGATPRGKSSTYEQMDNCPTLTDQKYFSRQAMLTMSSWKL